MEEQKINMEETEEERLEILKSFCFNLIVSTEEVLAAFLSGLSVRDLKNFRLASKTCLQASMKTWREKTLISVDFANAKKSNGILTEIANLSISSNHILQPAEYPFHNFQFYNWAPSTQEQSESGLQPMDNFLKKWASSIHFLVLKSKGNMDMNGWIAILYQLQRMDNLSTLSLIDSSEWMHNLKFIPLPDEKCYNRRLQHIIFTLEDLKYDGHWIKNTLRVFPCLKKFEVSSKTLLPLRTFDELFRESTQEEEARKEIVLKISGLVNFEGSVESFLEANLPLQSEYQFFSLPPIQLQLYSLSTTGKLGELKISEEYPSSRPAYHIAFPFHIQFSSVVRLQLRGRVCTTLNFLKFMPALKSVEIEQIWGWRPGHHIQTDFDSDARRKQLRLKTGDFWENTCLLNRFVEMENLTCFQVDCRFKTTSLEELAGVMPNLRILSTILTNATFRVVSAQWPKLRELTIQTGSTVDDYGIAFLDDEEDEEGLDLNRTRFFNLEHFEMRKDSSNLSMLTDVSVHRGFLCMPSLKSLQILNPTKISNASKDNLRRMISVVCFEDLNVMPASTKRKTFY